MKVIFNTEQHYNTNINDKIAVALGFFDGIHKGHRQLIKALVDIKNEKKCSTMVYTFNEHPMTVISPKNVPLLITDNQQKIEIMKEFDIDYLVFNKFTPAFANILPEDFVCRHLLNRYSIDTIVVGYNFKFGKGGSGDINTLKQLEKKKNFNVKVIPPIKLDGKIVSSSTIRTFIKQGKMNQAANFLGYPYRLKGKIIKGKARGRKLGFPTANIEYNTLKVIPKKGVYLTLTFTDKKFIWSLTNIGSSPTFEKDNNIRIETHLLGFSGNLYNQEVELYFFERIRDEKKFKSSEELIGQLNKDLETAAQCIYKIIQMCYNT
ncbi:MAG TPA: bifunctional riboflavin kinase/FAD synthetase [Clostridiales bacterium]|nr:bifunctional riboflavin kinase/FAD synthetase [Clostridiales bacterium]